MTASTARSRFASRLLPACLALVTLATLPLATGCPGEGVQPATPNGPGAGAGDGSIELVESAPIETNLDHDDIPNAGDVWLSLVDEAKESIDFAEFYASDAEPAFASQSKLTPILAAIERATARNVRVRFLVDAVFAPKYPKAIDELRRLRADVRILDEAPIAGGVHHAKYFVVDGKVAYVGSQNFDWRALTHIQEMGAVVRSPAFAGALEDVFDTDWELASGAAHGTRVTKHPRAARLAMARGERISLVASPKGFLPDEATWDLPELVSLLDHAKRRVTLQVLTYKTKERNGAAFTELDDALRRAAKRGVAVQVLVSEWGAKPGDGRAALEALVKEAGVEVRVITIPPWSGGEIPFARVAHAKYLVVDDDRAWVGTSNWEGDYFTKSRNVGIVVEGGLLPRRLSAVFAHGFGGSYAAPIVAK